MARSNGETPQPTNTHYAWYVCAFLVVVIGLIYGQTLGHTLLDYDDNGFVYGNPHVTPGLTGDGVRWAFIDGPGGEWYPLAMLSHMLDCQFFGLNAWGHHLTSVLLHAATSIGLFLVLRQMTGELWPSAFVAAIFAVHPQHVESVAWVAERKNVLSGLFFVLTLGIWLGYVRHGRSVGRYVLVAVLFALGLLAKPMIVTLPALLLLLDFWPLAQFGSANDTPGWARSIRRPGAVRLVLEALPLFALAAGDCLMTLRTHAGGEISIAWPARFGNALVSCVNYILGFLYPFDLAAFYPFPPGGPPAWKVIGAAVILATVGAAAVIWRRPCAYFFVGWFWYLGMLLPVLGLVKIGWLSMADRYMYLPGIGLYIALAWGGARLAAGSPERQKLLAACAGLAIAALTICSVWQTSFWYDDESLWRHALAVTTDNGEAEVGLADALARRGQLDEAITYYGRAKQHATDPSPYINLGALLCGLGKEDEGISEYRQALAKSPNSSLIEMAHANLGLSLTRQSQFDEAWEHFVRAAEINPRNVVAHCGLAHLLRREGKLDQARLEFEQAIASDPKNAAIRNDLAAVIFEQGKIDESIAQFEAALAIDPKYVQAHVNLASALIVRGRIGEAAAHYRQALQIEPNNPAVRAEIDKIERAASPSSAPLTIDPNGK